MVFIAEGGSVYCAVKTGSSKQTYSFVLKGLMANSVTQNWDMRLKINCEREIPGG